MAFKEKTCKFCGQAFIPESSNQRFCKGPHYRTCPICKSTHLVTDNAKLIRPEAACSYPCRMELRKRHSLEKYGVVAPGSTAEARKKAKATMIEKYGGATTMQSEELRARCKQSLIEKYGVDNASKNKDVDAKRKASRKQNRINFIHSEFPLKIECVSDEGPHFVIDEKQMEVYTLKERACVEFLKHSGCQFNFKFGKVHQSFGLVKDGILYQVIRFEKHKDKIWLANLGTRRNYVNPNGYSKLLATAIAITGVDEFVCELPRSFATNEVINSLSLELVKQGEYKVYWKVENGLKKLSERDNIEEMKSKYEYVTTDYLDLYQFKFTK